MAWRGVVRCGTAWRGEGVERREGVEWCGVVWSGVARCKSRKGGRARRARQRSQGRKEVQLRPQATALGVAGDDVKGSITGAFVRRFRGKGLQRSKLRSQIR